MNFAKDNIDSALDVSLIVKANSYGRKGQMTMTETNKLRLKKTTAEDLDEFTEMYGSYLVVGFEYGGEIMYSSTHSVRSQEDKLKVAGGLSYDNCVFMCRHTNSSRKSVRTKLYWMCSNCTQNVLRERWILCLWKRRRELRIQ